MTARSDIAKCDHPDAVPTAARGLAFLKPPIQNGLSGAYLRPILKTAGRDFRTDAEPAFPSGWRIQRLPQALQKVEPCHRQFIPAVGRHGRVGSNTGPPSRCVGK